ncbi:hypothetical protein DPV78_012289 [Talaromyces pinophilus]|nr:hypothetical protein DPV78_012289 [Talaromyces pinophilus]
MSEARQVVFVNDNFDPLQVLLEHSKIWKVCKEFEPLVPSHSRNDAQARAGFKCHDVYLFNNPFCCWIHAIVEQRLSGSPETNTITKKTLFNVDLTVKVKNGDGWLKLTKPIKDVGVMDVIECEVSNGTRAFVAVLCILIDFKWHKVQYTNPRPGKWFDRPTEDLKVGLTIEQASEFHRYDMPFRYSDPGTDPHYTVATEYAIRKFARKHGFIRVNVVERSSPDKSLFLYEDLYLRKGVTGKVYIRVTIENKDPKWPVTTNTPFTMELQIKKGTEEEKRVAKPYHADITAFYPWAVHTLGGCSIAFFGFSLPIRDAYEVQFFEEAFACMASLEVKYVLTRQSLQ